MGGRVAFNRAKFTEIFSDHLLALKSMVEAMEAGGDPRDACVVG